LDRTGRYLRSAVRPRSAFIETPVSSADSDDAAMSFRDHAAIYSGLIPPPCVALFDGLVLG
jgi:hypothetical protein